jgi:hypothetical protein
VIHGIDHIVIISADLDKSVAGATHAGFTVVTGGTHKDGNTHNALIAFRDGSYIELIAPTNGIEGKTHRWFPRLAKGGGLVDLCLASDDVEADTARIREHGWHYSEPEENGRYRPDGVALRWIGSMPPGEVGETGWPFLIEDVTPRENRVSNDPGDTTHANGALGIAGVTVLAQNLVTSTKDFAAITGKDVNTMNSPLDDTPLAGFVNFDRNWLMITRPSAGEAMQHLEKFGPGPFSATLRTHDGPIRPGTGQSVPSELISGASLELV